MSKIFYIFTFLFIATNTSQAAFIKKFEKADSGFVINGIVTGFKDNTWIYLKQRTEKGSLHIDSAIIINGNFQFKGNLLLKTVRFLLETKDLEDHSFLWIENSTITFEAKKGSFRNSVITGSTTQLEQDKLNALINPIKNAKDSIRKLINKGVGFFEEEKQDTRTATLKKKLKLLESKEDITNKLFIQNNPNSIISASVLDIYTLIWKKETVAIFYSKFSPDVKNSFYGKDISAYINSKD